MERKANTKKDDCRDLGPAISNVVVVDGMTCAGQHSAKITTPTAQGADAANGYLERRPRVKSS